MVVRIGMSAAAIACSVTTGNADVATCDGIPVTVSAPGPALADRTCRAATRAVRLLAQCGVKLQHPQRIEVKEAIPGSSDCLGVYHCGKNRIELLSPAAIEQMRSGDGAFHALPSDIYFDSVVAHELAHAAYDAVPCPYPDCLLTSDYVAYAMQVHSLPPAARKLFETDLSMENKISRYELSVVGLLMSPRSFARKAWVHFSQREDGCAYVGEMMRANFYLDTERP